MSKKLKKDFDRDKMYSKIMPTSIPEPEALEDQRIFAPVLKKEPAGPPPELELSAPSMHNYMEDMLREKLMHTMKVLRSCQCERCQLDVLAIALNALPAAYAVTEKDDSAGRIKDLRREYEVKVTATLIKAIQQVKSAPRHTKAGPPLI